MYKRQLLTSTTGLIIGKVIFQKFSQPVAPSMEEASYKEGEMPCRPVSYTHLRLTPTIITNKTVAMAQA